MGHWHEILAHPGNPGGITTRLGVDPIEPPLNSRLDLPYD